MQRNFFITRLPKKNGYHFNTEGIIYGFGYGPKYRINKITKSSIGCFEKSEYPIYIYEYAYPFSLIISHYSTFELLQCTYHINNSGKMTQTPHECMTSQVEEIEKHVDAVMNRTLLLVTKKTPFRRSCLSPKVSKLQIHEEFVEGKIANDNHLLKNGFINSFLCINACTGNYHTEMDSSYTILCVPKQKQEVSKNQKKNIGQFELFMNDNKIMIIPMKIGTIITYSGYMVTHRQQVRNLCHESHPFINLAKYNSRRLFAHMLESFRRNIGVFK